jgi:DNA-binding transcriptional regulator YhcF (GntR family)
MLRHTMSDNPSDTELAKAILAAIIEAREHGVPDERIVEMLAEIVKELREALSC